MRRTTLLYAGMLAAVIAAVGAPAGEVRTIRVGVCLSLTGEFRQSGLKALAGVRMRMEDHNAGPNTAFRVGLVIRDDSSDPATAAAIVEELAGVEGLQVIIGPLSTNLMRGMREVAARRKVVLVSPSVTSPQIGRGRDWAFRLLFDDEFQGVALARYLARQVKAKRAVSLVNKRLAYANSVNAAFKRVFEEEGGKMVREEFYEWVADEEGGFDFLPALKRLLAEKPDAVLLPNNSTDVTTIIHQSLELGSKPFFCGGDTWLHENILLSGGNNVEGAVFVSGINYDSGTAAMRRFLKLYDESNDPDAQPASVLGYDAASLVLEALRSGDDAETIRDALYRLKDFQLATGVITIDPERGSEKTAYINRIVKKGDKFAAETVAEVKP